MFARISAKFLFLAAGAACVFFGVGLLGLALASALTLTLGASGAYAVTGGVLLLPVILWVLIKNISRPAPPPPPPPAMGVLASLVGILAKETPWIAILGTGVVSAVDMFLKRRKPKN